MAAVDTANNPNDPNNPNVLAGNVNQPAPGANQPATTGGAGGVTATGAGNVTGQVVGTANPSQPFQNISSYLAANAPQSQALAQQVAGTVSAPITEASQGITNAANTFTGSVNAGYTPENKDLITAVSNNPAYVTGENPENVQNFLSQLNNKYTGPTDFTQTPGYSDIQAQIAAAQAQANNTTTEGGIQSLLKGVEGPTTAGINRLDSLLLDVNPENLKTIQAAGAPAANLLPTLNTTTAAQNALAAQGAANASTSVADALAALGTAQGGLSANLGNEQNTIEGIVNQYNKSVGVINPVVSDITAAIQNFLAANPNIKLQNSADPMAALENIASIVMPQEATYASPEDYAQIAALTQLGDTNLGGLPITSATANQAQTFQVPTALQNALGQAPGVETALQNELAGFGGEINAAVQPFQDLTAKENLRADLRTQLDAIPKPARDPATGQVLAADQQAYQAAQQAIFDKASAAGIPAGDLYGSYADQIRQAAQGLQWVNATEGSYQDLINQINAQLGKLGTVGAPTLNYAPGTVTDPVTGVPIGKVAAQDIGKGAELGITAAGTAATPVGTALAAAGGETAAETALAEGAPVTQTTMLPATALSGLSPAAAIGPAALAGYGASNIVQNELANPVVGGLETLGNMGLTLATMSLPPQIFQSIGKDINNVLNSIGEFFGGLF